MRRYFCLKILLFSTILVILSGCGQTQNTKLNTEVKSVENPTPQDFLKKENADIFVLDGIVFSNATNVKWVEELEYTLGEEIGEIIKQSDKADEFTNGTANKLPVGTKIYETDTQIYIAIADGKEIPYLKMVEG